MKLFRWLSILEYRKNREEQVYQEHVSVSQRLAREKDTLFLIQDQMASFFQRLQAKMEKSMQAAEITLHHTYLQTLTEMEKDQQKKILEIEQLVEAKRLELVEAFQEKKIMEKLKEKFDSSLMREERLEEQKILDERASLSHQAHSEEG